MAKELRIRNFPPELLKALKIEAARREVTLRELVIEKASLKYSILIGRLEKSPEGITVAKPVYGPYPETDKISVREKPRGGK